MSHETLELQLMCIRWPSVQDKPVPEDILVSALQTYTKMFVAGRGMAKDEAAQTVQSR